MRLWDQNNYLIFLSVYVIKSLLSFVTLGAQYYSLRLPLQIAQLSPNWIYFPQIFWYVRYSWVPRIQVWQKQRVRDRVGFHSVNDKQRHSSTELWHSAFSHCWSTKYGKNNAYQSSDRAISSAHAKKRNSKHPSGANYIPHHTKSAQWTEDNRWSKVWCIPWY